jgi:hypothetical protein
MLPGMRTIRAHVPGGLGNQLTAYFVALSWSNETESKLVICLDSMDGSHTNGRFDITSFNLSTKYIDRTRKNKISTFRSRLINGIKRRNNIFKNFHHQIFGIVNQNELIFSDSEVGYFESIISHVLNRPVLKRVNLYGYFQNYKFIQDLDESERYLTLRNPSRWFQDMEEIARVKKPIMMHCRLGDYMSDHLSKVFGVLDYEYYQSALNALPEELIKKEVWLFSNDLEKAKELYSNISKNLKFIECPLDADPAETLLLLTLGCAVIASNSSFSLISAVINQNERLILVPSTLFRKSDNIQNEYPGHWKKIESKWLDCDYQK